MNYKEMCEIIKAVSDSNLTFLEIKANDLYMKMSKGESLINDSNIVNKEVKNESVLETNIKEVENTINNSKENKNLDTDGFEIVTSPLVGMFYKSPSPDSEPYVKLGSKVNENDVLCIVEAMKLMNEIESCVKGEVVEIFVNDGEMVEYNQPLFKIKKD